MTRENKIALIVGFALVLVVGVLISDHLSRARQLELNDPAGDDPGLLALGPGATLPDSGWTPPSHVPSPTPTPVVEAPAVEPFVFEQGTGRTGLGTALAQGPASGDDGRSLLDVVKDYGGQIRNGVIHLPPAVNHTSQEAKPAAPAESPRVHFVAKGESLFGIAKRYYGDGNQWRRIAEHNRGKVSADGTVREGVRLEIPGVAATGAPETPRTQPQTRPQPREATPRAPEPQRPGPTTYTVRKGDTLGEIAQRTLGSSRRMSDLLAANKGRIDDPDDIRAGMVLTIPAR
ncbi:MAG TPA: LysM peptidoglycan-binding domain-containing protein [Phycisphaerales bacterium]|nr:LysM peptidoglycan-binding domain-containing protein [Phycisphaerales bacterium]